MDGDGDGEVKELSFLLEVEDFIFFFSVLLGVLNSFGVLGVEASSVLDDLGFSADDVGNSDACDCFLFLLGDGLLIGVLLLLSFFFRRDGDWEVLDAGVALAAGRN